jgi:hypothetical protein
VSFVTALRPVRNVSVHFPATPGVADRDAPRLADRLSNTSGKEP